MVYLVLSDNWYVCSNGKITTATAVYILSIGNLREGMKELYYSRYLFPRTAVHDACVLPCVSSRLYIIAAVKYLEGGLLG